MQRSAPLRPFRWERLKQPWQPELLWLPLIQNWFNDIRREQRQPQQRAEVPPLDPFRLGHLAD